MVIILVAVGFVLVSGVIGGIGYFALLVSFGGPEAMSSSPVGLALAAMLYICILILVIWPSVRILLAFPHAAITGKIDLGLSWRAMRGNFWRYMATAFIFSIIALSIYMVFAAIIFGVIYGLALLTPQQTSPGTIGQSGPGFHTIILAAIPLNLFLTIFGFLQASAVTMFSMIYKALVLRNYEVVA